MSCPDGTIISEFNYEELRGQNLNKVEQYYNKILADYETNYQTYIEKKNSDQQDEQDEANFLMNEKGVIKNLNNHLIDIKSELNKSISSDFIDLEKQKNKVEATDLKIADNKEIINNLNKLVNHSENTYKKNVNNVDDNEKRNDINQWYHIYYISTCVILLIGVLVTAYLVYYKEDVGSLINNGINNNTFLKNNANNINNRGNRNNKGNKGNKTNKGNKINNLNNLKLNNLNKL